MNYQDLLKQVMSKLEAGGSEAVDYIDNYIKENPNSYEGYLIRGELDSEAGLFKSALEDIEKVIQINPNEAIAYYDRGLLCVKSSGDINKALNDFNKAIELNANYVEAYVNRANMYLKLRELQKAINDCTKAIELSQNNFEAYFNRGLAYVNIGEFAKALDDYNKVIELAPENAEAYAKRGLLHSQLGNVQEAIRNYEKFLELDPNNKNATLVQNAINDLRNGKNTLSSTKTNVPLIIMLVGAVIGGIIVGSRVGMEPRSTNTEILIGALVGVFLGSGIGPFLISVINLFTSGYFEKKLNELFSIYSMGMKNNDNGCVFALFFWAIGTFFTLSLILIKSPFVAIQQCLSQYNHKDPNVKENSL